MSPRGALSPAARFRIVREGGLVAAPGLMRPREITLDQCAPEQQQRLAALVDACRQRASARPGRGDQRFFRLELFSAADPSAVIEQIVVDETEAPPALVGLWEHGIAGLD